MSFFKKIGSGLGRFARKIASSKLGQTVLGAAATLVGGPVAGVLVAKATAMLGEKKVGEMASKVVTDGTVKVDKVISTMEKSGITADKDRVNEVVEALRYSAMGIGNKSISIMKGSLIPPGSGTGGSVTNATFIEKVKAMFFNAKNWLIVNWKKVALYGLLPAVVIVCVYYFLIKKTKYRR